MLGLRLPGLLCLFDVLCGFVCCAFCGFWLLRGCLWLLLVVACDSDYELCCLLLAIAAVLWLVWFNNVGSVFWVYVTC